VTQNHSPLPFCLQTPPVSAVNLGSQDTQPNCTAPCGSVAQPPPSQAFYMERPPLSGPSPHIWAPGTHGVLWAPQANPWVSFGMLPTTLLTSTLAPLASFPVPPTSTSTTPAPTPTPQVCIPGPPTSAPPPCASTPASTLPLPDTPQGPAIPELSSSIQPKKVGPKPRRVSTSSHQKTTVPDTTAFEGPCSQLRGALSQVVTARLFPDSPEDTPPSEADFRKVQAIPSQAKVLRPPPESRRGSKTESRKSQVTLPADAGDPQPATAPKASTLLEVQPREFKMSAPRMGAGDPLTIVPPASSHAPSEDLLSQATKLLQAAEGEGDSWALGYLDGGPKPCICLLELSLLFPRLGRQRVSGRSCVAAAKGSEGRAPAAEKVTLHHQESQYWTPESCDIPIWCLSLPSPFPEPLTRCCRFLL
jgi:hypothetical protein